jgi:hypothetical protein
MIGFSVTGLEPAYHLAEKASLNGFNVIIELIKNKSIYITRGWSYPEGWGIMDGRRKNWFINEC